MNVQRPSGFYGISKTFGELRGRFCHRKYGLDFRGVRVPSVVGPGARTAHMSIYNAWAIEQAIKGLPYVLKCAPATRCPVLYFKDAARALIDLSAAEPSRIQTRACNIAGIAPAFSAQELVEIARNRVPGARLVFEAPGRGGASARIGGAEDQRRLRPDRLGLATGLCPGGDGRRLYP